MRTDNQTIVQDEASAGDAPSFIETARRKQIIECAIDAIAELGFARASLAEISKRAKVSKGVISYYFGSKDELIRAVIEHVYSLSFEFMYPRIEAQASPRAQLREYILTNVAFMASHPRHVQATVQIVWGFRGEDGESKLDPGGLDAVQAALEDLLRRGQEAGEMREFLAEVMAFAIRSAIDMIPPLLSVQPDLDLERYGEELADTFDRATRAEKRRR
jgi:AcrR family transcriptional regulator